MLELDTGIGKRCLLLAFIASREATMPLLTWLSSQSMGAGRGSCAKLHGAIDNAPCFVKSAGTHKLTVTVNKQSELICCDLPRHNGMLERVNKTALQAGPTCVSVKARAKKRSLGEPTVANSNIPATILTL